MTKQNPMKVNVDEGQIVLRELTGEARRDWLNNIQ